jgi:hypothetical protein
MSQTIGSRKIEGMSLLNRLFAPTRVSLEDQLEALASCGIRLRTEFSIETLLESFSREEYETKPHIGALIRLGGEVEREPWTALSDNMWHVDMKCIETTGDYTHIAERMKALAQGELPIENIRDHVELENGDAWVAFELNGETIEWHARVHENWIDPGILSNFCSLLTAQGGTRRFTFFDLKGQYCLVGCATEEELRKLRNELGLKFSWLE